VVATSRHDSRWSSIGGWRRWWPAEPWWAASVAGDGVMSGAGRVVAGVVASSGWMLMARGRLNDGRELEAGVEWIGMGDFFC
jgi:hypothetical protein